MVRLVGWLWGWRDGEVSNLSLYLSIFNFLEWGIPGKNGSCGVFRFSFFVFVFYYVWDG